MDGSIDDYADSGSGEDTGVDYSSQKILYFYDENPHLWKIVLSFVSC